jgi:hypothetical protein
VPNAASNDRNTPAKEIPVSYLCIINSDTAGMADKELQNQMLELSFCNASFAHGLAASIYMGNILWNNHTTPSNLPPFTIYKLDPLSVTQTAHCLHLHLLSKNTEGKSLDEIKALQIQEVKVPTTFKELHQTLLFYLGIITILFGLRSALVIEVKSTTTAIQTKKTSSKDASLPTATSQ